MNPRARWLEVTMAGAVLATGLVIGIGQLSIHRSGGKAAAPELPAAPPPPLEPAAALAVLEAFFEAPDLASRIPLVRDPARVGPMMEDYHEKRRHPFPTLSNISPGRVIDFGQTRCVVFEVQPFSGPRYPVAVVRESNRLAVDWESLTAYGTIDWDHFLHRQPREIHTLRVYLAKLSRPEPSATLPLGHVPFRLEHRDSTLPLVAYAAPETAVKIAPLVEGRRVPATIEVSWKPIGPNGVPVPVLLRLVAPSWSW